MTPDDLTPDDLEMERRIARWLAKKEEKRQAEHRYILQQWARTLHPEKALK